jgi:hypothetical protein
MELGVDAVRRVGRRGQNDPVDQRAQDLAGLCLDAVIIECQLEVSARGPKPVLSSLPSRKRRRPASSAVAR